MQEGAGVRQVIEDELRRQGVRVRDLDIRLQLGLQEPVRSAVTAGYGVAFISRRRSVGVAAGRLAEARVEGIDVRRRSRSPGQAAGWRPGSRMRSWPSRASASTVSRVVRSAPGRSPGSGTCWRGRRPRAHAGDHPAGGADAEQLGLPGGGGVRRRPPPRSARDGGGGSGQRWEGDRRPRRARGRRSDRHQQGSRGGAAAEDLVSINTKSCRSWPCRRRTPARSGHRTSACSSSRVARAAAWRARHAGAAVYDAELTLELPLPTVGTAMNALAHCAEAYYHPATNESAAATQTPARRRSRSAAWGRRSPPRSLTAPACSRARCTPRSRSQRAVSVSGMRWHRGSAAATGCRRGR